MTCTWRSMAAALACFALAACGDGARPGDEAADAPPRRTEGVPAAAPPGVASASGPAMPYVVRGLCPFECCTYGEWTASEAIAAYGAERDTTRTAFTLAAGERFVADTGNVHVDQAGIAVVTDTAAMRTVMGQSYGLAPGDTVHLLAPVGEGHMRMWREGRTFSADPVSGARIVSEPRWDWWARVRNQAGAVGWLRMSSVSGKVRGVDACGG